MDCVTVVMDSTVDEDDADGEVPTSIGEEVGDWGGGGFFWKCVCWCLAKWAFWRNLLPQTIQEKGFSPVWVRMCTFTEYLSLKPLLQTKQWCNDRSQSVPLLLRWNNLNFWTWPNILLIVIIYSINLFQDFTVIF